ncbi:MAG: hypothetical protein ACRDTR_07105, partial [Rubrobacter sp.]
IGMTILVDGETRGYSWVTTNERDSHRAFVPASLVVEGLPAGDHTIRLEAAYASAFCNDISRELSSDFCTSTNSDNPFSVTVVEIPD